jgi:O-antigen/teichoic acid export membrane protein
MGYRYSKEFINKWEKRLTSILLAGLLGPIVLFAAVFIIGSAVAPDLDDDDPAAKVIMAVGFGLAGVAALTVVGVIFVAAIMGGQSLHRHGWVVGTLFATWFFAGMWVWYVLSESSDGWVGPVVYFGGHALLIVAFRYLGRKAKVPMYLNPDVPHSPDLS